MNVRPVQSPDAEAWLAMRCALWPDGPEDEHRGEIERFFADPPEDGTTLREPLAVLVAEEDDAERGTRLVGFAELSLRAYAEGCSTSPVAYLEGWYVAADRRQSGVGRALVEAAEAWARAQGCRELASDVEPDNRVSDAAHRALGFADAGLIRCFAKSLDDRS